MGAQLNPETLPSQGLIVLGGIPGSGKSSTVHRWGDNVVYISTDEYRAKAPNSAGSWDQSASRWAFTHAFEDARKALGEGKTVVFDSVAASERARKDLMRLAPSGAEKHLVVIHRGLEAALEGNRRRGSYDPMREIPEDVIHRFHAQLLADAGKTAGFDSVSVVSQTEPALNAGPALLRERAEREAMSRLLLAGPEELDKALADGRVAQLLPDLAKTEGYDQKNKHHKLTLYEHIREVYGNAHQSGDPRLMWAALLHDLGKPESQWIGPNGQAHYYRPYKGGPEHPGWGKEDHEVISARMGVPILVEYGVQPADIRHITMVVRHHMFQEPSNEAGMRKLLTKLNGDAELLQGLITFRECDRMGKGDGVVYNADHLRELAVRAQQPEPVREKLAISGNHIRSKYGLEGPEIGKLIKHLQSRVESGSIQNQSSALKQEAQRWIASSQ
jgi:tRNA nucleotidyltransferase (CCA-adding enzyme)